MGEFEKRGEEVKERIPDKQYDKVLEPKEGAPQSHSPEERGMASDRKDEVQRGVFCPTERPVSPNLQEKLLPASPGVDGVYRLKRPELWQAGCHGATGGEMGSRKQELELLSDGLAFPRSPWRGSGGREVSLQLLGLLGKHLHFKRDMAWVPLWKQGVQEADRCGNCKAMQLGTQWAGGD